MKKKLFIILGVLVLSTSLLLSFTFKKENNINKKGISKVEKILEKPAGIQAYTLNGEKTDLSYSDLISSYVIDTIACKNGTVATYKKEDNSVSLSNIHMPDYCTMDFKHTFYSKLLSDNPKIETRTDFSTTFTTTNTGTLYKSTESIAGSAAKDVYYFAGDAKNNWVKFGKYKTDRIVYRGYYSSNDLEDYTDYSSLSECIGASDYNVNCTAYKIASAGDPMYWRIIRTNYDGSIRLLYSGTSPDTTEGHIGISVFNSIYNDPMYVGYMYGTSGTLASNRTNENDSTIKIYIDNWYSTNLSSYTNYLSTEAVYCNDRELDSEEEYSTSSSFDYAGKGRLHTNKTPNYNCANSKDAFSGSNSEAKLTYPIGLMTADEVAYAGGVYGTNLSSPYAWYYNNSEGQSIVYDKWWLLSPHRYTGNYSRSMYVNEDLLSGSAIYNIYYVRPVINLKKYLTWKSGDGSSESPYEVDYGEGVSVTLSVINGSGSAAKLVEPGSSVSFTGISPYSGYSPSNPTISCTAGSLSGTTFTINNVTSTRTCTIIFRVDTPPAGSTLLAAIKYHNPTIITRTDFSTTFTTTNTGTLYKSTESIAGSTAKDVYYFAGDAKNNWVKFAGFYWRIIRTNHDGSVRLLYSGSTTDTTSGYIGTSAFNITYNNPMYVGYMYGTNGTLASNRTNENDSTIKTYIDNWYSNNLSNYTKYISTEAVYCNDREIGSGTYSATGSSFYYAPYTRLVTNETPMYDCTNSKDAFSGNNSEAKLTYPIGLMTADEISYAGGSYNRSFKGSYTWYYNNSEGGSITGSTYWWLLSPYENAGIYSYVWYVGGSDSPGDFDGYYASHKHGVRPAISLKTCTLWTSGNGAPETPYEISLDTDISC